MAKSALITGLLGQDGYYLADMLLIKGYQVIGAVRKASYAALEFPADWLDKIKLVDWDPSNQDTISGILSNYHPTEVYNLAAYSSGAGMFDEPISIGDVNGLAVARILEAIREIDKKIRFCQASSSEMFGDTRESPQSEHTLFVPRTPYGAAKLYAHSMIGVYRRHYGLFATSAILFNHESPRRGLGFVSRKVTHQVARIKLGFESKLELGNLEARRDWGFAGDYVRAMWLMLQANQPDDFVVATGKTHSVRELCEYAFNQVDLNYRDYVHENKLVYRPNESTQLVGCAEKAKKQLGWKPEVSFGKLIGMMVKADLKLVNESSSAPHSTRFLD